MIMKWINCLKIILICFPLISCVKQNQKEAEVTESSKPNIIYILTDQWRAQSTGYSGDPNLVGKTPNLDRLAEQSINFTNAFSVTPVCTPYRAALLTGQFPTTTGMFLNDLHLPDSSVTMAEIFKESGYETGYIGKWHLDGMGRYAYTPPERRQGFEYWKALECSHNYSNLMYYAGDDPEKKYWEGYGPYAETKDAISYIQQQSGGENPFLLVLAWGSPHFPYHKYAPEDIVGQFSIEDIILRENVPEELAEATKVQAVGYYEHIVALDKCLGQLQKAIDDSGISENTIIVFTSDHGETMGSQGVPARQKQVPWIESVKVPFLLKYPARYQAGKVEAPINTPDVVPTLLSIAGLPIPPHIEGEDMSKAITDDAVADEKAALIINAVPFAAIKEPYRGIYTRRYAYFKKLDGPWLLYDNLEDSLQMNNLANKPGYEQLQTEMEAILQSKLQEIGDEFRPGDYYLDKWGYKLTNGHIDYSEGAPPQGPGMNN